jgi:hypothetical protein
VRSVRFAAKRPTIGCHRESAEELAEAEAVIVASA